MPPIIGESNTMTGKTIKNIFQTIAAYNNACDILNEPNKKQLLIYIDDEKIYTGANYKIFVDTINDAYVPGLAEELTNILICGSETNYIKVLDYTHKIEVYIINE